MGGATISGILSLGAVLLGLALIRWGCLNFVRAVRRAMEGMSNDQ